MKPRRMIAQKVRNPMASITIRNIDDQLKARLRVQAAMHASLATRNVKDFADCGIELINPWDAK